MDGFLVETDDLLEASRAVASAGHAVRGTRLDGLAVALAAAMPGGQAASVAPDTEDVFSAWAAGWSSDIGWHALAMHESAMDYVDQDEKTAAALRRIGQDGSGSNVAEGSISPGSNRAGQQDGGAKPW